MNPKRKHEVELAILGVKVNTFWILQAMVPIFFSFWNGFLLDIVKPLKLEYIICNYILEHILGHWPLCTYTPHLALYKMYISISVSWSEFMTTRTMISYLRARDSLQALHRHQDAWRLYPIEKYGQSCIASPFHVRECNEAPDNQPVQFRYLVQIEITLWIHHHAGNEGEPNKCRDTSWPQRPRAWRQCRRSMWR